MRIAAGVDIGNSTTEACIAEIGCGLRFLKSSLVRTTGQKGSLGNFHGVMEALSQAAEKSSISLNDISVVLLNEAAPVISGTAMETVTQTSVTGSSMLGHDPRTPAGYGVAAGYLVEISRLPQNTLKPYIVIASSSYPYERVAEILNSHKGASGLILQSDEAVLVYNRLEAKIPVIDEVKNIHKLKSGCFAAIEVAPIGETIKMLSNPFGIASLLGLTPEETKKTAPVAKSLIGNKSAAVIKMPGGTAGVKRLRSGKMTFLSCSGAEYTVDIDSGASEIMETLAKAGEIKDVYGQENTNIGNMLKMVKGNFQIKDILAVDTLQPVVVEGGLSGEQALEKAVGVAAMVETQKLPMQMLAERLQSHLNTEVKVGGVEAVMAVLGALTTPGLSLPVAVLDMGGGSTDGAILDACGNVKSVHLAGAGALVTLLIQKELGLKEASIAENIKKYPLAAVESIYNIRLETGERKFYNQPLNPKFLGETVILSETGWLPLGYDLPMERVAAVRTEAKRKVFVKNARRAVSAITAGGKPPEFIVLLGGSAEDFEIPNILTQAFIEQGITCGRGNTRKTEGARNAVATGLLLHYAAN